jgi:predicted MFS family arabinose efflux permease
MMSKNEKMILLLLSAINFTHILDFMIMMPLGNYLMPFFHISPMQFSFLVGAYTLSAAVSGFSAAFFVDRYDRRKVLLLGYSGFVFGTLACGLAPTYLLLLIARIVAGLFGGIISAQVLSIISDLFAYERRGAAMGAVMSAFSIASTLGVPFSLYLANLFSWHAPFLLVGGLGFFIIFFVGKYVPPMMAHIQQTKSAHPFQVVAEVAKNSNQRLALLFSGLIFLGHFLIIPFINPFLEFNRGYSKAQTPMVYLVGGIASFFAAHALGKLSDKVGKLKVFTTTVFFSLFLVWAITNMPYWPFVFILLLFAIWFSLSTGRAVTAQAMISNIVPAGQRGSFMSFNSSVQQLGSSIASFLAGAIVVRDSAGKIHHYYWLGYLSILILGFCLLLGRYLFGKIEERKMEKEKPLKAKIGDEM